MPSPSPLDQARAEKLRKLAEFSRISADRYRAVDAGDLATFNRLAPDETAAFSAYEDACRALRSLKASAP